MHNAQVVQTVSEKCLFGKGERGIRGAVEKKLIFMRTCPLSPLAPPPPSRPKRTHGEILFNFKYQFCFREFQAFFPPKKKT